MVVLSVNYQSDTSLNESALFLALRKRLGILLSVVGLDLSILNFVNIKYKNNIQQDNKSESKNRGRS